MIILQILLWSYLVTTGISIIVMPIRTYRVGRNRFGKRLAFLRALEIAGLCFIPYLSFCAMIYIGYLTLGDKLNSWAGADPTSPKNIADPGFVPPPKKEKKFKSISDRFEILDL